MIRRIFGATRRVGRVVFNRRTATVIRWKTFGPNLSEIDRGSRFLENKIGSGFLAAGRGARTLRNTLRGGSFRRPAVPQVRFQQFRPKALLGPGRVPKLLVSGLGSGRGKYGGLGAFRGMGSGWRRLLKGRR